jgi:hypothetical protein
MWAMNACVPALLQTVIILALINVDMQVAGLDWDRAIRRRQRAIARSVERSCLGHNELHHHQCPRLDNLSKLLSLSPGYTDAGGFRMLLAAMFRAP